MADRLSAQALARLLQLADVQAATLKAGGLEALAVAQCEVEFTVEQLLLLFRAH